MTIRELQAVTEDAIEKVRPKVLRLEFVTMDVVEFLHQRLTLMEKIHDFRIHPDGPSYLDVEPEVIEKLKSNPEETEDGNGKAAQHDKS